MRATDYLDKVVQDSMPENLAKGRNFYLGHPHVLLPPDPWVNLSRYLSMIDGSIWIGINPF